MTSLDPILPGFIKACSQLYAALLPWGMALLVIAFAVEFWHGAPTAADLIKLLVKVFLVVLLVAKSQDLINDGQTIVQQWVEHYVPALPENVAARYKEKLAEAQNDPSLGDRSFLGTLFSSDWFEAIIFAVLTLVSWLAMAVLFFVYCVQRAALLLCWVLSPLLFPLMAIRPLSGMGLRHLLRIVGIILWPLGLALAATFTDGLLDVATDQNFLGPSMAGSVGRGLTTLLSVAVIAVWIVFSTIVAPAYIQRLVAGSTGPASLMLQSAGAAANLAASSVSGSSFLARMRYAATAGMSRLWRQPASSPAESRAAGVSAGLTALTAVPDPIATGPTPAWHPSPTDPTGDLAARAIIEKTKNP